MWWMNDAGGSSLELRIMSRWRNTPSRPQSSLRRRLDTFSFVCLFVRLFVCLFIRSLVCLFVHSFVCPSIIYLEYIDTVLQVSVNIILKPRNAARAERKMRGICNIRLRKNEVHNSLPTSSFSKRSLAYFILTVFKLPFYYSTPNKRWSSEWQFCSGSSSPMEARPKRKVTRSVVTRDLFLSGFWGFWNLWDLSSLRKAKPLPPIAAVKD